MENESNKNLLHHVACLLCMEDVNLEDGDKTHYEKHLRDVHGVWSNRMWLVEQTFLKQKEEESLRMKDKEFVTNIIITLNKLSESKIEPSRRSNMKEVNKSPRRTILMQQTQTKATVGDTSLLFNKTKHKSNNAPLRLSERTVIHGRNFIPLTELEEPDKELECVFTWVSEYTRNLLDDIADVNDAEKKMMWTWNVYINNFVGVGKLNLARLLWNFVDLQYQLIFDMDLYRNFACHVTSMQQAGLITNRTMVDCFMHMQELGHTRVQNKEAGLV